VEFIGAKRIHASAQKSFEYAARDSFPELFSDTPARADSEKLTLEWTIHAGISGTLEVKPNGPSQADLTLKVKLEDLNDARAAQIPTQIESALERVRDAVEAEAE